MDEPLVSVIVPLLNAQEFIRETLDSILAQTYKNLEIIVINDGSTDDSESIALSYGTKIHYISQNPSGNPAAPRNVGLRVCRGDLITFLDADDILLPDKIERQVEFLKRNPLVSIVLTDYINFSPNVECSVSHFRTCPNLSRVLQKTSPTEDCILDAQLARWILLRENFSITNSLLVRRELIKRTGEFDESVTPSEDFDLMCRIVMREKIGIVNYIGFRRRLHENNTTRNRYKVLRGLIRSREKLLALETAPRLRRDLRTYIRERYFDLCDYHIGQHNGLAMANLIRGQVFKFGVSMKVGRLLVKMTLAMVKSRGTAFPMSH
jgi:glycosyltransferase involved in cell wall biosynthesis